MPLLMNRISRRATLAFLLAPVMGAALPAHAQAYPDKAVRVIVPFAAGTATDTIARLVGQHIADALKQPVVVDNRAGANGAIGADGKTGWSRSDQGGHRQCRRGGQHVQPGDQSGL